MKLFLFFESPFLFYLYFAACLLLSPTLSARCIEGNCRNGVGTYTFLNGNRYQGEWKRFRMHGHGTFTFKRGKLAGSTYVGEWEKNKMSGTGTIYFPTGDTLHGEFRKNKIVRGRGSYTFTSGKYKGCRFTGQWLNNKVHGPGVFHYANGNRYEGQVKNNMLHGRGTFTYASGYYAGSTYTGEFARNKFNGPGTFRYANGNVYEGEWKNSKKHGTGIFIWANGNQYEGEWKKNKFHGHGTFTYHYGKEVTGRWRRNRFVGR